MQWYSPYYDALVNTINKEGNKDSSKIKKLLNLDKIRIFLEEEPEDENLKYTPLLHLAVINNAQEIVKALLENGANVNISYADGHTLLYSAVLNDALEIVKILLEYNIDTHGQNYKGETALMLAIKQNNYDMIKLLLSHDNIDHNICNDYGDTAFELALMNRYSDDIIVTLWHDIDKRIKNGTLKDHSIKLVKKFGMKEELDRLEAKYRIDIKSMVELIYIPELEGYGDEESDMSEESEISENQILEHQETEPGLETFEIEVEAGSSAKRSRLG
ncbi:ankyrin repeat domain-containing protein [Candidatus Mesenet endosymbiont of Agriotes lineatus]|uniref:ankyrin repeat domain-containing protein n=1 Tax=Candidatus Mesenet endosymbiont of Agriotes lineatus TaxID=3077948 RepID=UPI0030CF2D8D